MNETDLRVIKTRESIEQAFLALLAKKPLEKISVVELAWEARINKGTFYLHFTDIYDLYHKTIRRNMRSAFEDADYFGSFFDDRERFCRELTASFSSNLETMGLFAKGDGLSFLTGETLDLLREKIYATGRIRQSASNDMRLDALFGAFMTCRPRYEMEHGPELDHLMVSMVSKFKPA